jgi:tetratricopeptide (TPR) repeat protein
MPSGLSQYEVRGNVGPGAMVLQGKNLSVGLDEEKLVNALAARGILQTSETAGLQRRVIINLARSLKRDVFDFDQAVVELERAVEVALKVIASGERGTNPDEFVDKVLSEIAEKTRRYDFDGGAHAIDAALAELDKRDAEQREMGRRARAALLEAGVRQDTLRRDAVTVAGRILALVTVQQPAERPAWLPELRKYFDTYIEDGVTKGINFSLSVAIELAQLMVATARDGSERGTALHLCGAALAALGERESDSARLKEAIAAYRAALEERTRERVPVDWATTQNNLGGALSALAEREGDTARWEDAVAVFRAVLEEQTRERVPLDWALTQNNLGGALSALSEREIGTARLEEAVAAYRAALEELTREREPLQWALTEHNLGGALSALGLREGDTARLEEAVAAYRAVLEEQTRERGPLQWAVTQNNLGAALAAIGRCESDTARLEEAVAAYRAALEEWTRERVPLHWAMTQNNLGSALQALGEREIGTARLEEAIAAYRAALEEQTRERVPLQWATTQYNLGTALQALGWRDTARLEQAVAAYRAALEEWTRERVPLEWALTQNNLGIALQTLGWREIGTARLEEAVAAFDACLTVAEAAWSKIVQEELRSHRDEARAEIRRRAEE